MKVPMQQASKYCQDMSKRIDTLFPNMGTVNEAAKQSGLSPYFIRNLCREGKIPYITSGKKWLINLDKMADYMNDPGDDVTEGDQNVFRISE